MKTILFGDLHVYSHFNQSIFVETAIEFLYNILNKCKEEDIKKIIFLGDWFHLKSKIPVYPFIKSINALSLFKKNGIDITFLIGNHDAPQQQTNDYSIICSFSPYGKVIKLYDFIDKGDVRLHFLSYTKELPKFEIKKNKKNILFGHLDINDFEINNEFICDYGFNKSSFKDFDLVFSGHFHKHQKMDNCIYVGNPFQTRFSERFDDKGYVILDLDDLHWNFIVNENLPVFREVTVDNIDDYKPDFIKDNFIRVKLGNEVDNKYMENIRNKLLDLGAESIDFIFDDENEDKKVQFVEELTIGDMSRIVPEWIKFVSENKMFDAELQKRIDSGNISQKDLIDSFSKIKESFLSES